ncbi:hypothetical protein SAMN05216255_3476 [Pseudomonas segetis]|uniref:Uncharacterized protein n=1 Tax=Pseudomonas segetis TaxID=298908 RepID=A0A239HLY3_9PSED|nr:hypothetical protein SAMN05216255_3476 [Pseudomonas segetis]
MQPIVLQGVAGAILRNHLLVSTLWRTAEAILNQAIKFTLGSKGCQLKSHSHIAMLALSSSIGMNGSARKRKNNRNQQLLGSFHDVFLFKSKGMP